jgi:hypothetical protein
LKELQKKTRLISKNEKHNYTLTLTAISEPGYADDYLHNVEPFEN